MDGFKYNSGKPVFVMAATNYRRDQLDHALLRRFNNEILFEYPTRDERKLYLEENFGDKEVFKVSQKMIDNIAERSNNISLAILNNVIS